jgi:hypothetical protein
MRKTSTTAMELSICSGGKSGWDNGPELGGAILVGLVQTPLAMDNLKSGQLTKASFRTMSGEQELQLFNQWLKEDP